jgi:hypothetical protein
MSNRLATRIGLPAAEERPAGALDVVAFHEPPTGALVRTKGSLFLLAQVTGTHAALGRAAREMVDARFGWPAAAARFEAAYDRAAAASARSATSA